VRGLDYYTRTTFEFYAAGREGQQDAIGGGGRYDGLVELLGGRATPGIGFGIGLDRTVLALEAQGAKADERPAHVAVIGEGSTQRLLVASALRDASVSVRLDGSTRKLGRQLESAAKAGVRWTVIVSTGDVVTLKDLSSGEQRDGLRIDEVIALVR
jgi:histidyl-tRNA synthetase